MTHNEAKKIVTRLCLRTYRLPVGIVTGMALSSQNLAGSELESIQLMISTNGLKRMTGLDPERL